MAKSIRLAHVNAAFELAAMVKGESIIFYLCLVGGDPGKLSRLLS